MRLRSTRLLLTIASILALLPLGTAAIDQSAAGGLCTRARNVGTHFGMVLDSIDPSISPATGQTASVTVRLENPTGIGVPHRTLFWQVIGTNSASASPPGGTMATRRGGLATFSYTNANPGTDTVRAYYDRFPNRMYGAGEPTGTATITWNEPWPVVPEDRCGTTGTAFLRVRPRRRDGARPVGRTSDYRCDVGVGDRER